MSMHDLDSVHGDEQEPEFVDVFEIDNFEFEVAEDE